MRSQKENFSRKGPIVPLDSATQKDLINQARREEAITANENPINVSIEPLTFPGGAIGLSEQGQVALTESFLVRDRERTFPSIQVAKAAIGRERFFEGLAVAGFLTESGLASWILASQFIDSLQRNTTVLLTLPLFSITNPFPLIYEPERLIPPAIAIVGGLAGAAVGATLFDRSHEIMTKLNLQVQKLRLRDALQRPNRALNS